MHVALSTPSLNKFESSTSWTNWNSVDDYKLADINADGKNDILGYSKEKLKIELSNGVNSFTISTWLASQYDIQFYIDRVDTYIDGVDTGPILNLTDHITELCKESRDNITDIEAPAAQYIKGVFEGLGYSVTTEEVKFEEYNYAPWVYNIIATKPGSEYPNSYIEFTAHYDTSAVNLLPTEKLQGAKDNASGVASVLEIARILFHYDNKHSMRFIAFASEEKFKFYTGSRIHVDKSKELEENILGLNIDTTGTATDDYEYVTTWYRGVASYEMSNLLSTLSKTYSIPIEIVSENIGIDCQSDELAYYNQGLAAITSLGDWRNSHYHEPTPVDDDETTSVDERTLGDSVLSLYVENVRRVCKANLAVGIALDN